VVQEVPRYGEHKQHYLSVKPGMTGLWQVSGRNNLSYMQRVALDARYVETRSLPGDLSILLRTVRVLFTRDGAH
jgi:lipopolysaccharide/colanic/teichoic acid biosynthesis glycosyltransferase